MAGLILWLFWVVFSFWDIVLYCKYHSKFQVVGWKTFLTAIAPGSGFYYMWLDKQKT